MMTSSGKKKRIQEKAIALLLEGKKMREVAGEAGISTRTLVRWVHHDEDFGRAYQDAKHQLLEGIINRLRSIGADSVETLHTIAEGEGNLPGSRVSASRAVLELLYRGHELEDFESRLDALERALKGE